MLRSFLVAVALALIAASCGSSEESTPTTDPAATTTSTATTTTDPTGSSTTSSAATSTTSVTSTTDATTTTTDVPECDPADAYSVADEAISTTGLAEAGGEWTTDTDIVAANPFAERTIDGEAFAANLALDCSVKAAQTTDDGGERLLLATWTGPRFAYVIQATDQPETPFRGDALVTILTEDPRGQFFADDQSLFGAQLDGGESLLLGHIDYNLGATAKSWQVAIPPPGDGEVTLESQQHGIDVLRAAGARNVSIAEPPQVGSEEGLVQFISPTGQIGVVDVAPTGWFDPLVPRYYRGETTTLDVDGTEVRVTDPGPDDGLPGVPTLGADIGWSCSDFVWLMEPPPNGGTDEMIELAEAIIATDEC